MVLGLLSSLSITSFRYYMHSMLCVMDFKRVRLIYFSIKLIHIKPS